ncbi:Globin-coupled histidine kinase [Kouleothrix aurantiaca]|jgi:hypothetical protein|uniref:Globin-coupled histidine kinase n=1 Tax=Kouleothrix aurantiaca TaxID=186479 RepID=A0A0P9D9X2_9CHLR|nr:Globin-coupled histidine kinase [Kouleothrix aurantiaca]
MSTDHASWHIKGDSILTELIAMMDLSAEETATLGALQGAARVHAPALLDAFYQRLLSHSNTAEYLQQASMDRLHTAVANWFTDLFSGNYNEQYAKKRLIIGDVHVRIGLPVRYPLAMIDVIMPFGEQVAKTSATPDAAIKAFHKVLSLDIAIFNQAYEDNQLKHLAELVGGERLARLLLSGQG